MRLFTLILCLSIFTGCASNRSKDVPSEVYELENKDFERPKPLRFVPSRDYFAKTLGGPKNEVLKFESSQRIAASDIDDEDVVSELAKLCQQKKSEDSRDFIRKNYDRYRDNPAFWNQVGICYLLQEDYKKALLFFNKSIDYKGDYAPAYNNLGVMYWRLNEIEKAQVAFEKARGYGDFSNTPKLNLAFLYLQYQLSAKAEPILENLYSRGSQDLDVAAGLMNAYLLNNKLGAAQNICTKLDDEWDRAEVGINCAKAFFYDKKIEQARKILSKVDTDELGQWKRYYNSATKVIGVR